MARLTVSVPLKVEVDLDAWAEAYGFDLDNEVDLALAKEDARTHVTDLVRDDVRILLTNHGSGASLKPRNGVSRA